MLFIARTPAAAQGISNPSLSAKRYNSVRASNLQQQVTGSCLKTETETRQNHFFGFVAFGNSNTAKPQKKCQIITTG